MTNILVVFNLNFRDLMYGENQDLVKNELRYYEKIVYCVKVLEVVFILRIKVVPRTIRPYGLIVLFL